MTQYLDAKGAMPEYIPYPKFILKMNLTANAKVIYAVLLDRYTLSRKNGWKDDEGHIYLVYPHENLAADCDMSLTTVKRAMSELNDAGLIRRSRKGFSTPSRIYLMIPEDAAAVGRREQGGIVPPIAGCENNWKDWFSLHPSAAIQPENDPNENNPIQLKSVPDDTAPIQLKSVPDENSPIQSKSDTDESTPIQSGSDPVTAASPTVIQPGTDPSYSPDSDPHTDHLPTPNHVILNPIILNHSIQTTERAYGTFGNVMLTEEEYGEMSRTYPDIFPAMLDFLSVRVRDNQIPDEPHSVILRRMLE